MNSFPLKAAFVCGLLITPVLLAQNFSIPPVKTCTVTSIGGVPIAGLACGGSSHGLGCTAGALYNCKTGPVGTQNNCTLAQACSIGCITKGSPNPLADKCFSGTVPLTLSTNNILGGEDLAATVTLINTHPGGAYVNLSIDRGDLIPGAYCAPPDQLAGGANSASFGLSTAVVSSRALARMFTDLSYIDASGVAHDVVSVPQRVTLNPGGTEPPAPPLASFTLTPSTIAAGGQSEVDVTLAKMAPASGVKVQLTSSNPSVASINQNALPVILGSCTTSGGSFGVQAASSLPRQTTVTISASDGAAGQNPLTRPLTVTSGCVPVACSGGPACGPMPDGCGGTHTCGCSLPGQTCGGGGMPGQCGPAVLAASSVSMNPSTVTAGNSSIGTVTLNGAAPSGGALVTLSSTNSFVQVPSSITIAAGLTSGTFTASTTAFTAGTVSAEISASIGDTVTTILTVNPAP
ncbi:MAG TPA: hypothetical protein VNZ03_02880 [Terriglobales bacterium]|jgi:hypothetical protein|nr:hypothetical protein [Terriglobales bacterium]